MNMKKVYIILLNYEGVKDTLECVLSLEKISYKNYEIVVVDNESRDNSYEQLNKIIGHKHTVMKSGKNGGFAYGNNVGIKYALENDADYVLLINNDTTVEEDFLNILVDSAEEEKNRGIVTGLILNYYKNDLIWYGGGVLDWGKGYGRHINAGQHISSESRKEKDITFATGCLMLLKAEMLKKIGGLPEEYFMYFEDVDFCAKVLENNYRIHYNPRSVIYHKISAASGEEESPFAIEWTTKNRLKFMKKYKKNIKFYTGLKVFFYGTRVIKVSKYYLSGRNDKVKALVKGLK